MTKPHSTRLVEGIFILRRNGSFLAKDPEADLVYPIDPTYRKNALHGDEIQFELVGRGRDTRAQVTKIRSRRRENFVCIFKKENGQKIGKPDDPKVDVIFDLSDGSKNPRENDKIVVEMTEWNGAPDQPKGEILDILGPAGEHETEIRAILSNKGIIQNFQTEVKQEAEKIKEDFPIDKEKEAKNRCDFRSILTFTIDPDDAKDFDDAISFKENDDGTFEIGIHIADVSHYVRPGTELDKEASRRATSVYMVDRTIPMLPEVLSNDICSLVPNQDRLTFSAVFVMDTSGNIHKEWYGRTIIHSDYRLTYNEAKKQLDSGSGTVAKEISILNKIARKLKKQNEKEGAVTFPENEVKFTLDENGKPIKVTPYKRHETHELIEQFMLLANRKVAEFVYNLARSNGQEPIFVYRIHDKPDLDRITALAGFLRPLGYELEVEADGISNKELNRLLAVADGRAESTMIGKAAVRSMSKAIYSTENIGHWGLGFRYYTHFTSPIRRYPDVLVHRLLCMYLAGKPPAPKTLNTFSRLAMHSSEKEKEAADAERDSIRYKQIEYLAGQSKNAIRIGIISSVTDWGLYVEDAETKAEGLIPISSLPTDFYDHKEGTFSLVGRRTGNTYRLGDEVKFKIKTTDPLARILEFSLF